MYDDSSDATIPGVVPPVTPPSPPDTGPVRKSARQRPRRIRGCLVVPLVVLLALASGTTAAALTGHLPIAATLFNRASALVKRSPSPSPTPTAEPTATPLPAPGCRQPAQASAYVCYSFVGQAFPVPAIPGLTQTMPSTGATNLVTYVAAAGNPYGLPTGAYAGAFTYQVQVRLPSGGEGRISGGVVLEPPVVLALLHQQLARLTPQSNKWIIPLPLDPRPLILPNPGALSYVQVGWNVFWYQVQTLALTFDGSAPVPNLIAPVANTFPDHSSLIEMTDGRGYSGQGINFPPYTSTVWPGHEMSYITVRWANPALKFTWELEHTTFGQPVVNASDQVYVLYGAYAHIGSVPPAKVLCIGGALDAGGVPVFLATR